jgi:carbonic anhydrase
MDQSNAFQDLLHRNQYDKLVQPSSCVKRSQINRREIAKTHQPLPDLKTALAFKRPGFIIISCSDPRLNPYKMFGLDASFEGRVTMIRNAGGRAIDAVRTISALQTIGGAKTILVVHHNGNYFHLYTLSEF